MAKAESQPSTTETPQAAQAAAAQQTQQITIDDSKAFTAYANYFHVTGTAEEMVIDFGLNAQPGGTNRPVGITQRVVLNPYTAKRLLAVLHMSIQRHEATFGTIETDMRKRVVGGGAGGGQTS